MSESNSNSPQTTPNWYSQLEEGVRKVHVPGDVFEWLLVDLSCGDSTLSRYIENPDIRSVITDSYTECGRFRLENHLVFRIEFPNEIQAEAQDLRYVLVLNANQLFVCYSEIEPKLEASIQDISSFSHVASPMFASCEIIDDTLDLLRDPLTKINAKITILEEDILAGNASKNLDAPIMLRQSLLTIDRHLDALEALLQRTLLDRTMREDKKDIAVIREVTDRTAWLNQRVSNQLDRIRGVSDQLRMIAMDNLNMSMFRLSIIATVFLPLSFITGLLGINVGGIPGATNSAAFWIVCTCLTTLAVVTFVFLIKALKNR